MKKIPFLLTLLLRCLIIILMLLGMSISCKDSNTPNEPKGPYIPNKPEIALFTNTTSDLGIIAVDKTGEKIVVYGNKNSVGIITKVTGGAYVNAEDKKLLYIFGEDGLPSMCYIDGDIVNFVNYTKNTVDIVIQSKNDSSYVFKNISVDENILSQLRGYAAIGISGSPVLSAIKSNMDGATEIDGLSPDALRNTATGIRITVLASQVACCVIGLGATGTGIGLALAPFTVGCCASSAIAVFTAITGDETLDQASTAYDVFECTGMDIPSCTGLGAELLASFLEKTADDIESHYTVVSGQILDAINGSSITGATVSISDKSTTTDSEGKFFIDGINRGNYQLTVTKSGYITIVKPLDVFGPTTIVMAISSGRFDDNYTRVALVWGSTIEDLDIHAINDNGEHVYFSSMISNSLELDTDDTDFYGPEHITIKDMAYDVNIYVHNFSLYSYLKGRSEFPVKSIKESGAAINIFRGNQIIKTYSVPRTEDGQWWYVCKIKSNGTIVDYNYLSNNDPTGEFGMNAINLSATKQKRL